MKNNIKINLILITICALGICLSSFSGWLLYEAEEKTIIGELKRDVDERASSLYRELLINFETLQSLAILLRETGDKDYERFRSEAQRISSRHRGIQALEWIPRITHSERAQYVSRIRKYFPEYEITERQEQRIMVRAKERQEYYPVYFIEPLFGNEAALGFDLSSSPARLEALQNSRDRDAPQATASITLVQENEKQKGFLAFLPIYRSQSLTVEQRRKNLVGFVLGVYRIGDIFTSSAHNEKLLGLEMTLVDETSLPESEVLYKYHSRAELPANKNFTYRKVLPEILGRKWSLIASPTVSYVDSRRQILPQVIFGIGIVFTLVIALYFKMIAQRTVIIQKRVVKKTKQLNEANRKLKYLSRLDSLTGIANRRHMDEILDKEWFRAIRNRSNISIIFIDIDYFKLYNDNYGHLMGDECLKEVAATLKDIPVRPNDLVSRYGGEEFTLVLPETSEARTVAEKCRRSVEQLQIPHEFSEVADVVTISIGACTCSPNIGTNPKMIIDLADKALYKAKESGRNRVEVTVLDNDVHLVVADTEKQITSE